MSKAINNPNQIADTAVAFDRAYRGIARPYWDEDGPTPFVAELEQAGDIRDDVFDAGCGTGENALYLAARGYRVTAIDASPSAIEKAQIKARERRLEVDFQVADARQLVGLESRFNTVIDSGLFHALPKSADRQRYAEVLWRTTCCNAVLHVFAFKDTKISGAKWLAHLGTQAQRLLTGFGTHGVSDEELRTAFGAGWSIESVGERVYRGRKFLLARVRRI